MPTKLRLQAFSITEDKAGSDTTSIETAAVRDGDDFIITGHKSWTSRIKESDLDLVLGPTGGSARPARSRPGVLPRLTHRGGNDALN